MCEMKECSGKEEKKIINAISDIILILEKKRKHSFEATIDYGERILDVSFGFKKHDTFSIPKDDYRWHDLDEDPSDIPTEAGRMVRVALNNGEVIDAFYGYGDFKWYTMDTRYFARETSEHDNSLNNRFTVIAWRNIEKYEVIK